jgi:hypothetical protein
VFIRSFRDVSWCQQEKIKMRASHVFPRTLIIELTHREWMNRTMGYLHGIL